jgi:hypothetical protein
MEAFLSTVSGGSTSACGTFPVMRGTGIWTKVSIAEGDGVTKCMSYVYRTEGDPDARIIRIGREQVRMNRTYTAISIR